MEEIFVEFRSEIWLGQDPTSTNARATKSKCERFK